MSKNKTKFEVFISKSVSVQLWGDIPSSEQRHKQKGFQFLVCHILDSDDSPATYMMPCNVWSQHLWRTRETREDKRYKGRQECTNHFRINLAVIQPSCHLFTRALFCCHCKCNLWSFSFAIFKVNWKEREEIPKILGELDSRGSLLILTHLWGTFKSRLYHFAEIGYSCVLEYPFSLWLFGTLSLSG